MKMLNRVYGPIMIAGALVLTSLAMPVSAADAGDNADVTVFKEVPSPHDLADILFPQKSRSIVVGSGSAAESAPRLFGMLINFEFGKAAILPESIPYLDSVGRMLNLHGVTDKSIVIEGHTDAVGGVYYNQQLSEQRAVAIRRYLVEKHGVKQQRLHTVGLGETQLYDYANPSAAVNRRVQFRPLPSVLD